MTSTASLPDAGTAASNVQSGARANGSSRNGGSSDGGPTSGFRDVLAGLDGDRRTDQKGKPQGAAGNPKLSALAGRLASADLADESTEAKSLLEKSDREAASGDEKVAADISLLAEIWPSIQRSAQPVEQAGAGAEKRADASPPVLPDDDEMAARLPANRAKVSVVRQEVHFEPTGLTSATREAQDQIAQQTSTAEGAASLSAIIGGTAASNRKAGNNEAMDQRRTEASGTPETDALAAATGTPAAVTETDGRERGSLDKRARDDRYVPAASTASALPDATSTMSTSPPLTRQIADRVAAELASIENLSGTPLTSATTTSISPQGSVLKILHIKLEPENLGTVTVRLSLKDDALQMQLEASRPETADLLSRDRDALSNLMRSAGYSIDATTVAASARPDSGSNAGTNASLGGQSQADSSAQSQQGSAGSEQRGNDARNQQQTPAKEAHLTADTQIHETGNRTLGGDALYI